MRPTRDLIDGQPSSLFGLAPSGVCLAGRSPGSLVGSYPTVSPLPVLAWWPTIGGLFSVALSVGSPRLGVTQHRALWSPDFPQACTRGRPADSLPILHARSPSSQAAADPADHDGNQGQQQNRSQRRWTTSDGGRGDDHPGHDEGCDRTMKATVDWRHASRHEAGKTEPDQHREHESDTGHGLRSRQPRHQGSQSEGQTRAEDPSADSNQDRLRAQDT